MKIKYLLQGNLILRSPEGDAPDAGGGGNNPPPTDPLPALIDENLNFAEGYQDRVGEYAKDATYKNLGDVFKTAREGQATITKLSQEKAALAKQLQEVGAVTKPELPADAAAYKEAMKLPQMPEGVELQDAVLNKAVEYALEKGYPPEVLSDFLAFDIERAKMESEASRNEALNRVAEAKAKIVEAVGEQNYENTVSDAKFVSETLGLPLDAEDLVNQPNMVVALSKLRQALSEGTLKGASLGGVEISKGGKLTQAEDILTNPENPLHKAFFDPSHPQYDLAQQTHARLIAESAS